MAPVAGGEHRRFSASVLTFSLRARVLISAPVVIVGTFLSINLVLAAVAEDPRPAALLLVLVGGWAFPAWKFLRPLWAYDVEWAGLRAASRRADEQLRTEVARTPAAHLNVLTPPPVDEA